MTERAAELIWLCAAIYAAIGALVAAALILRGLRHLDPAEVEPPWRDKVVLAAGLIALWPLLLPRAAGARPSEDRR